MPRVSYICNKCKKGKKKFYPSSSKIEKMLECECGGEMLRQLSSPTTNSKMVVDNGFQAKATELDRNIVEMIEDRENNADVNSLGDAKVHKLV